MNELLKQYLPQDLQGFIEEQLKFAEKAQQQALEAEKKAKDILEFQKKGILKKAEELTEKQALLEILRQELKKKTNEQENEKKPNDERKTNDEKKKLEELKKTNDEKTRLEELKKLEAELERKIRELEKK